MPELAPADVADSQSDSPEWAARFHDHLRALESGLAGAPVTRQLMDATAAAAAPTISVGHRREFAVCSQIPCTTQNFETVRAEAMFVGERAAIYQDLDAPAGGFTETDFTQFGQLFDDDLYAVGTEAFGVESDVDGNGVVVILLTPAVNRLTDEEECDVSFVTGFFFAVDIDPAFGSDPRSNQGEVFYGLVPDPNGTVTCEHSTNNIRNLIPVTFVHEFQHMINYHQRVLVRGGTSTEVLWLNEALSHLAEELAAFRFRDAGDNTLFNRFAIGNIFNLYNYLTEPADIFTLAIEGSGTLAERGSGWAFLRWMVDRHGANVTRRLSETQLRGVENVEAATGVPIERLLSQWFLANWVSDRAYVRVVEFPNDVCLAPRPGAGYFRSTVSARTDRGLGTHELRSHRHASGGIGRIFSHTAGTEWARRFASVHRARRRSAYDRDGGCLERDQDSLRTCRARRASRTSLG
jgi:hypothetical protein